MEVGIKADQPRNPDGRWVAERRPEPSPDKTLEKALDEMEEESVRSHKEFNAFGTMRNANGTFSDFCDGCDFVYTDDKPSTTMLNSGIKFNPDLYRNQQDQRRLCLECRNLEAINEPGWLW